MPAVGNPTPPLVGGNSVRSTILEGYVFQSGLHKPEHSSILTYKYPQYYMTSLLDRLGAEEAIDQTVWSWNVLDRTREGSTIETIDTALPAATVVLDTDFDYTSTDKGYLIVGDLIRVESGAVLRVTATGNNGSGKQEITVVKQAGGNISSTDIQANDAFGHIGSAFGEASSAPEGRLYLPTEEYNYLHTHRRSFAISGDEFGNKTWLGDGKSWYFTQEDLEMKEFARDREAIILFGTQSSGTVKGTRGIWDYAQTYGVKNGFSAAVGVTETDLQEHIKDLLIENASNTLYVLCGAQFLADVNRALRDYAVNGAINYGSFGNNSAGLDFHQYKFMGKTINFAYYELFEDQAIVPTPVNGINNSTRVDFSNCSLWLDFGSTNGQPLISLKYKRDRKFIMNYVPGMMSPSGATSGAVPNGDDKFSINYFGQYGVQVLLPNRLGVLRAYS